MGNFLFQGLVLKGEPNLKLFNQLYWVVTLAIALCDKRGLSRGYKHLSSYASKYNYQSFCVKDLLFPSNMAFIT